ncbi:MAG: serine/threonine protein kinase [Rudaea sp.]
MDLQRIRSSLSPDLQSSIDLKSAWRSYRETGGGDDESAFVTWLVTQHAPTADPMQTRFVDAATEVDPIEVSQILPSRFNAPAAADMDSDAPTVLTDRSYSPPAQADDAVAVRSANPDFHYVLIGIAGKGGMGTVHIAKDTELLRRVALKQLSDEADKVASARTRFLREVQITAQLDHPNIVPVYALELAPGGAPAYTMKLVEGKTFHALLNETRDFYEAERTPDEAHNLQSRLDHFLKVCDAMAYAHDKGVIHRDLKPANLMLGRHNEVYVMDWGLCRVLRQPDDMPADVSMVMSSPDISGSASETQIGDVVGTPKYMSPEQAQGRNADLDARSDQCALGLILFEMVTLNSPYAGKTAYEVMVNAAGGKLRPIAHTSGRMRIPRELVAIIERATAFSLTGRYANVAELAADIRRYQRGEAVHAKPDAPWQRAQRWVVRHKQAALNTLLGTIAVAAIAIGGLLWLNQRQLSAERFREQRLLELSSAVSNAGDQVQLRFLQLEGGIVNLADSVAQSLQHGQDSQQRFFMLDDFHVRQRAPDDLQPSRIHTGNISLNWPVWQIPAGADQSAAQTQIRKLAPLQGFMRDIYARSTRMIEHRNIDFYSGTQPRATSDHSPLDAILVSLENGITARYPGWDGFPADYDARQRPWYTLVRDKHGPQWGDPYASIAKNVTDLPLSVPMYDDNAKFVGVVSAQFLPDQMIQSLFDKRSERAIESMYLIDPDGHILAATGATIPLQKPDGDTPAHQVFPVPELLQRVKLRRSGVVEASLRGVPVVIAYDDVAPWGWSVVAVANPTLLFASTQKPKPLAKAD